MAIATLTELNQQPSRVARLAETEPVHIQRFGRPYLVLRREHDVVSELRAAGLISSPRASPRSELPSLDISQAQGEKLYYEFENERSAIE
jgi:hypothetical protein